MNKDKSRFGAMYECNSLLVFEVLAVLAEPTNQSLQVIGNTLVPSLKQLFPMLKVYLAKTMIIWQH